MRKILIWLVTVCLLSSLMLPAAAAGTPEFVGSIMSAQAGSTVEFSVSVENNPGISSFRIYLQFDTDMLHLQKREDGTLAVTAGTLTKSGMLISNVTESGCQILWGAGQNVTGDGVLFTISLEADAFADGTYPIQITYLPEDTVNMEGSQISFTCTDGSVELEGVAVIALDKVSGFAGDSVTIPVRLYHNPGFATAVLTFTYDTAALELTSIKKGGLLTSGSGSFSRNVSAGRVAWFDSVETTGDGILFELTFTILAQEGYTETAVFATLTDGAGRNFGSVGNSAIPVAFVNGTVAHRTGALRIGSASLQEGGNALLLLEDAPTAPILVLVAAYENGKLQTTAVVELILNAGENSFSYTCNEETDLVKLFLLEPDSLTPLCASIEPK